MKSKTRPPPVHIYSIFTRLKENSMSRTAWETAPRPRWKGKAMRIINQRRERSVNFDNIEIHVDDKQIYAIGNGKIVLGNYSTEERASEVFEEIHQAYTGWLEVKEQVEEIKKIRSKPIPYVMTAEWLREFTNIPEIKVSDKLVYYMPTS